MTAHVKRLNEVPENYIEREYRLCFQECTYCYKDGTDEHGYRFIWRDPDNKLLPHRGQARIPDKKTLKELIKAAEKAGWF